MDLAFITPLLGIIQEGLKFLHERQRTKFIREHHEILEELEKAKNASFPNYSDAELDLLKQRLRIFLDAFWGELKRANVANMSGGQGREGAAP